MKQFSMILIALIAIVQGTRAQGVQGTIKVTAADEITLYLKSDVTHNAALDQLLFVVSVPTAAATTLSISIDQVLVPGITFTRPNPATYESNNRTYYTFIGVHSGAYPGSEVLLAAGTEVAALTLITSGVTGDPVIQLNDLTNEGGGNTTQSQWYVQLTPGGDVTNYTNRFYGSTQSTTGTDANGDQYVETLSTLPVTISSFSATADGCAAQLKWTTATETNSKEYVVETSTDGKNFTAAGVVASRNSSTGGSYSFTYNAAAKGINYFRLKVADKDGKFFNSDVKQATISCSTVTVSVTPNPVHDRVVVKGLTGTNNTIRVYSTSGSLVATKVTGNAVETLNASGYASGTYIVIITNAQGVKVSSVKIVKE